MLEAPPSMGEQTGQLVAERNQIVGAMSELARTDPTDLNENPGFQYLLGAREAVEDQLRSRGLTALTSDGGPVDRTAWCDHDPSPGNVYYMTLDGHSHGWCCTSCRRITQTG